MTLAGTRPPTVDEWDKYELHHRARLATKPGLTGMWQVSGRSNITDFEEVVKLDKQYISEWTMGLDITNIHYVVSKDTINEAITRLEKDLFPKGVNAVVFILYKPVGNGIIEKVLKNTDNKGTKEHQCLIEKYEKD